MGYDETRAKEKRQELSALIISALNAYVGSKEEADRVAGALMEHFITVSAPYREPPLMHLLTIRAGGLGGGTSTKPGNVTLNMRKLVVAIASGTLTMTGAVATPWALLIGALVTWDSLWSCLQLKIGEVEASVVWALWKNRDEDNTVAKKYVKRIVNRERALFGKQPLTKKEIEYALKTLERMGCIEESANDADRWWLREWVRISYE